MVRYLLPRNRSANDSPRVGHSYSIGIPYKGYTACVIPQRRAGPKISHRAQAIAPGFFRPVIAVRQNRASPGAFCSSTV